MEGRDTSILSAASPFAAVMPLSFINQVSKLFQQHQQPPSNQLRASLASHELEVQRAKCNASSSSSSSSSATVAAPSSQAPMDAVAWDEYEKLKSVRLLRATRKVFVFSPFWVRFVGCSIRGDRGVGAHSPVYSLLRKHSRTLSRVHARLCSLSLSLSLLPSQTHSNSPELSNYLTYTPTYTHAECKSTYS